MVSADFDDMQAYYARGEEASRLTQPNGVVEFERTKEIILRALPSTPATVADIGGGPGAYSLWLADLGYDVEHRDLAAAHVDQVQSRGVASIRTRVGEAGRLDLDSGAIDAVLILGPMYHLTSRDDRIAALREAARVTKRGGPVFVAAISRWAPRLDGSVTHELSLTYPAMDAVVAEVERTGVLQTVYQGAFCGYTHRPDELEAEIVAAGLELNDMVGVEGVSFAFSDLAARLADPQRRAIVFEAATALEQVPELLGLSPHLLATARSVG